MIKNLTIVGGGTAGLISALILKKRFENLNIQIVKSDKIGIIGVGEGSTEHWKEFMNYCDISYKDLIKHCDASIKLGVMFEGWTEKPYFHNVTNLLHRTRFGQYQAAFGEFISNDVDQLDGSEQDQGWVEGIFNSFGDAPGGFSEEIKEFTYAFGAEYLYNNAFALRGGYFHESEDKGNRQYFTLGAGFKTNALNVDLSYLINSSDVNNPLENSLRFSLSFDLGEVYDDY